MAPIAFRASRPVKGFEVNHSAASKVASEFEVYVVWYTDELLGRINPRLIQNNTNVFRRESVKQMMVTTMLRDSYHSEIDWLFASSGTFRQTMMKIYWLFLNAHKHLPYVALLNSITACYLSLRSEWISGELLHS